MLAVDVSNYTGTLRPEQIAAWKAAGVGLVIIQAFPNGIAQYMVQVQQMQNCQQAQMPYQSYVYDYLFDSAWRHAALDGLTGLGILAPNWVWADEEDTSVRGAPLKTLVQGVGATLDDISAHGFGRGIYTGRWWWSANQYMRNTTAFASEPLWDAHYDGVPNATADFVPYGGWMAPAMKQYAGTQPDQTDLDVTA